MPPVPAQCQKCHTCHAKWRPMSPSARPATQSDGRCRQMPCLPRKQRRHPRRQTANKRSTSASPVPEVTPATQNGGRCRQVPGLPRKVTVDVAKRHACHANSGGTHGAKRETSAPPEPAQCQKCHSCQAKWRSMLPSATPATQSDDRCRAHGAKREPSAPPVPAQCQKCHSCHAKWRSMSPSAMPAAQSDGQCRQVPRLPRKQRRRPRRQTGTKRATRASPVP